MMQDAPDDHNNYTIGFCIVKRIAVSQLNNNLPCSDCEGCPPLGVVYLQVPVRAWINQAHKIFSLGDMTAPPTSRAISPLFFLCIVVTNCHALMFTGPVAINVKVSLKPDRRNEFLEVITRDAEQTVSIEPGALQFAFGEDIETENVFYFHEQYKTASDIDVHKGTPHYQEWNDFCATDPFVRPPVVELFQCNHEGIKVPMRPAFCLNVELCIKPEVRDKFLEVILNNQKGSTDDEPLCLQYDWGESLDTPNHFYFHEQYTGAENGREGFHSHQSAPHFKAWEKFVTETSPFTKDPVVCFFKIK